MPVLPCTALHCTVQHITCATQIRTVQCSAALIPREIILVQYSTHSRARSCIPVSVLLFISFSSPQGQCHRTPCSSPSPLAGSHCTVRYSAATRVCCILLYNSTGRVGGGTARVAASLRVVEREEKGTDYMHTQREGRNKGSGAACSTHATTKGARRRYFSGEDKERRTRRRRRRKQVEHCSSRNTECRGQGATEETGMPVA